MEERKSVKVKAKLPVKLSNAEMVKRAKEVSKLQQDRQFVEAEYEGHKKYRKIQLEEIREKEAQLLASIAAGTEEREMECEKVYFLNSKTVHFLDPKTKALLHQRPMTKDELQAEMFEGFLPDPPKEKCKNMKCQMCGEKWFGGENNGFCHNCRKTEAYRFAKGT